VRFRAASTRRRYERDAVAAQLRHARLQRHARAQRGLLEEHEQRAALEGLRMLGLGRAATEFAQTWTRRTPASTRVEEEASLASAPPAASQ